MKFKRPIPPIVHGDEGPSWQGQEFVYQNQEVLNIELNRRKLILFMEYFRSFIVQIKNVLKLITFHFIVKYLKNVAIWVGLIGQKRNLRCIMAATTKPY